MAVIKKYWRSDGTLHDNQPGIEIVAVEEERDIDNYLDPALGAGGNITDMYNFAWYTGNCLKYIYATTAGRRVIDTLMGGRVTISYNPSYNRVTADARASLNGVAAEILGGAPGAATRQAVQNMNRFKFPGEFRKQPLWDIVANPGAAGAWNVPAAVTDDSLWEWVEKGHQPRGLNESQLKQLRLATISTLDRYSLAGAGSRSSIGFCIADTAENRGRPPAIGLAHELVHAYYSSTGRQCGNFGADYTLPLFEFKCVGLGRPWSSLELSENAIRGQWGAVLHQIPSADKLNKLAVGPRLVYD